MRRRLPLAGLLLPLLAAAHRGGEEPQAIGTDARGYFTRVRDATVAAAKSVGRTAQAVAARASRGGGGRHSVGGGALIEDALIEKGVRWEGGNQTRKTIEKVLQVIGDNSVNVDNLMRGTCPEFKNDMDRKGAKAAYGCRLGCKCERWYRKCYKGEGRCGVLEVAQTIAGAVDQDCLDKVLGRCKVSSGIVGACIIAAVLGLVLLLCCCRAMFSAAKTTSEG
mmetsp:Transcript_31658/g.98529  ORF Transcript_31658/g.98529 Transcript_31658/m.98529 type:complete len:222 (+) Transcript_31658:81-746(+)